MVIKLSSSMVEYVDFARTPQFWLFRVAAGTFIIIIITEIC